ncbi:hypothetical protein [Vogesella sp. LIG4]|uniref:hypothetical protein n=1 Tax=Vogesella sp. LIG4 TaxID=1192162 RepID=UPI00081FE5C4|nr:hypothetical protein [Vogesella sp. LIG4]SCK04920.1 hypothetical protein PSELUDRAFT_0035 [Vogesella sp. LIG4]
MKKAFATAALIGSLFAANAQAIGITYDLVNDGVKHNTNAYAGINIELGNKMVPTLVLGVFDTRVKPNGNTEGGNLSLQVNVLGGVSLGKLKLSYLNGKNDLQGEIGGGYDLSKHAPFASLGINVPYGSVGVDGFSLHDLAPSLTIHSQDEFKRPDTRCQRVAGISGQYFDAQCTQGLI